MAGEEQRGAKRRADAAVSTGVANVTILSTLTTRFARRSKIAKRILEKSEIREHFHSEWLCAEMWLVLPCLQRRVASGKAGENEAKVIEFISGAFPALLLGSEENEVEGDGEEDHQKGEAVGDAGGIDEISGEEVLAAFMSLNIEGLFTPSALSSSGFTIRQQAALIAQFGGRDSSEAARNFAAFLTPRSWSEILDELRFCSELPTKVRSGEEGSDDQ